MFDKIEMPNDFKIEVLQKVYHVAEQIYVINFKKFLPEGRTFSRSLDEEAELSYQAAAQAYLQRIKIGRPDAYQALPALRRKKHMRRNA